MARMFQLSHDGAPEEMRIFRDLAAALRWLGLDD
jgi:hypothetical protein